MKRFFVLASLLALAGCGGPERSNVSEQEVLQKTADPSTMVQPAEISPDTATGTTAAPATP
jgi:hypothetical protein